MLNVGPAWLCRSMGHINAASRVVLLAAAIAAMSLAVTPTDRSASAARSVPDVIVDTDVDFDDVAALAYLAEADRIGLIHLRSVSVSIAGFAPAGAGLGDARCLFQKLGMPDVPISDGDRLGVHPFPPIIHQFIGPVVDRVVSPDPSGPCVPVPTEGGAANLIVSSILGARNDVVVILLGPATNLAEALEQHPAIAARISRVVIQGGTPLFGTSPGVSLNQFADAASAQAVIHAISGRVFLNGQYATDLVPLTRAFRERLAADHATTAAGIVYALASDAIIKSSEAEQFNPQGTAYWWDPLASVAATVDGVVSFAGTPAEIVTSGSQEGRVALGSGGSQVRFGDFARTARFDDVFINVLNDRPPTLDLRGN